MIQFTAAIQGAAEAIRAVERLKAGVLDGLENFLKAEGAVMEGQVKESLSKGGRTGTVGPRGGKIVTHSQAGQPPFVQSGNLRAAQGYRVAVNKDSGDFTLDVGGVRGGAREVRYQRDLELGTSRMQPRPHLLPIAKAHFDRWPAFLKALIGKMRFR